MAKETTPAVPDIPTEDDPTTAAVSVPDTGDAGEGGKLKMIVQLVKKCLGVKDIASMRLSLPASLLEPVPNLEFWGYLDRPDLFAAVNDSEDPLDRFMAVIRFTLTKDLKWVHGKVCKPYNSVLGEHFRTHWDVPPVEYTEDPDQPPITTFHTVDSESKNANTNASVTSLKHPTASSDTASVNSGQSSSTTTTSANHKSPSTAPTSMDIEAGVSNLTLGSDGKLRIVYLTEQVSHHPPISAYYATCPSKHVEAYGVDQISAKVSGTTIRVAPGEFNKGMYIKVNGGFGEGEEYRITHPVATVNGILRGSFYITVGDTTIIEMTAGAKPGQHYRAIIEYKEEGWLSRPHFLMEGVVFLVDESDKGYESWTKVKQVPKSRQVAIFDGSWRGVVRWKRVGKPTSSAASSPSPSHIKLPTPSLKSTSVSRGASRLDLPRSAESDYVTLLDVDKLRTVPKLVRPLEKQDERESRKLWNPVTSRLLAKEYSEATNAKIAIEQKQRDEAAERKKKGVEFTPRFFVKDISAGYSPLTEEGKKAIEEELKEVDATA